MAEIKLKGLGGKNPQKSNSTHALMGGGQSEEQKEGNSHENSGQQFTSQGLSGDFWQREGLGRTGFRRSL
jgi:hypothetical protein